LSFFPAYRFFRQTAMAFATVLRRSAAKCEKNGPLGKSSSSNCRQRASCEDIRLDFAAGFIGKCSLKPFYSCIASATKSMNYRSLIIFLSHGAFSNLQSLRPYDIINALEHQQKRIFNPRSYPLDGQKSVCVDDEEDTQAALRPPSAQHAERGPVPITQSETAA